ncbi:MAG TPA: carbamoyltransferase C-terminal domain-containing protein, partial [Ignavibacteriaceae bacterium]|nr:carbamoyltransferase C-terminal domain-containing protein [Ignavibacteriaceae bacterium]
GNGKLLRSGIFDDIWIQPAAGDAGGALGAAYIVHYHYLDKPLANKSNKDLQKGSYLGPSYKNKDIKDFLDKNNLPYDYYETDDLLNETVNLLLHEKVIGWFQGRMEFGPRALGSRSIIGDARLPEMQKKMNLKIKFRESFRPFAPSILAEKVSEWFDLDHESPYMLLVADIKKEKCKKIEMEEKDCWGIDQLNMVRSEVPAITHIDYSARIQTVNKDDNPRYYTLLSKFYEKTKCPIIINTSFNVRGEPIVESPLDAYKCFMRTEMDALVLENFILYKENQPEFHDNIDWRQVYELD